MPSYETIPLVANETEDTGNTKSVTEKIVSVATSKTTLYVALVCALLAFMSSSSREDQTVPKVSFLKSSSPESWPTYLESTIGGFLNDYAPKGTIPGSLPKRPATTDQATEFNWKPVGTECKAGLGYEWAYDGTVNEDTPVTMYFAKNGAVNGIGIHYLKGTAPSYLVERGVFTKEFYSDTIYVTFSATDICEDEVQNGPVVDVLMTNGRRHSIPMTADKAGSYNWREGRCLTTLGPGSPAMGTHWEYDIDGGKDFSWKADTFFPVVPMYHEAEGTLNGIFFQAPAKMQKFPDDVLPGNPEFGNYLRYTNMWDGGPGLVAGAPEPGNPLFMCGNFCNCPKDGFTGAKKFTTMHWFFKEGADRGECKAEQCPSFI